jgi:anti-sigma factor RsiW
MDEPSYLALIHAEIDGELNDHQRAELSRLLLADPAIRALRDEMHRLNRTLNAIPQADPPGELRANIIAALPQIPARPQRVAWASSRWRYAAMLAGVLLTGSIVFRLVNFGQEPATSEMAGTLAPAHSASTSTLDVIQLPQGPVSGQVSLVGDGSHAALEMLLAASAPVDVVIETEGHTARVNGLGPRGSHGAGPTRIDLPGSATEGRPVHLTFLMGGQEVSRAVLQGSKSP